jgi:hypothetical protein
MVGYEHSYDPGTRPFPCSRVLVSVQRGYVKFDLRQIQSRAPAVFVTAATLHFRKIPRRHPECSDKLLTATEDWTRSGFKKLPAGEERYDNSSIPRLGSCGFLGFCQMNIRAMVNDWAIGEFPTMGSL